VEKEELEGYFTKRIMCRNGSSKDVKVVANTSRMLYDYNKKKFDLNGKDVEDVEDIIRDHAYSLTVNLASGNKGFFARGLFRKDKPYPPMIGFAMGSFDYTFNFAILNSLYIDSKHADEDLENMLMEAFKFWAGLMKARRMFVEKCGDEEGIISKLVEIKKEKEDAKADDAGNN